MIVSYTITNKKEMSIPFIRVELFLEDGKTRYYHSHLQLDEDNLNLVVNTHRVYLPCKILEDNRCILYVPEFWDCESIENYIQAFLDEMMLFKKGFENARNKEEIEKYFTLEILVF